jgi:alpha-L-rhamnosidase
MTRASQLSNVAAYMMTDCPTREKHGWMGDALDGSEQALFNFDIAAVHSAFMQTVEDNQGPDGDVPVDVPNAHVPRSGSCNDIAWTSAYPQIIHMHHTYYGDDRLARRHWPSLVRYQENLITNSQHGLAVCDNYEDWLCGMKASKNCCSGTGPAGSSCPIKDEVAGFNYVLGLRAMAQMAGSMGDKGNASRYGSLAKAATAEFHTSFFNPALGEYGGDDGATQSLAAPALAIGSPPANLTGAVVATVERDLQRRTPPYTANVGAVTSKIILNVLSDNGLHESALRVATQTAAPSWGYWWSQGATTCWVGELMVTCLVLFCFLLVCTRSVVHQSLCRRRGRGVLRRAGHPVGAPRTTSSCVVASASGCGSTSSGFSRPLPDLPR